MLTDQQIETKLATLNKSVSGLKVMIDRLSSEVAGKASLSDQSRMDSDLRELIRSTAQTVSDLDNKLAKVLLPEETRFYLEGSEVSEFQANFNSLKAMMSKFDKLYKNLVAYTSKLNT